MWYKIVYDWSNRGEIIASEATKSTLTEFYLLNCCFRVNKCRTPWQFQKQIRVFINKNQFYQIGPPANRLAILGFQRVLVSGLLSHCIPAACMLVVDWSFFVFFGSGDESRKGTLYYWLQLFLLQHLHGSQCYWSLHFVCANS